MAFLFSISAEVRLGIWGAVISPTSFPNPSSGLVLGSPHPHTWPPPAAERCMGVLSKYPCNFLLLPSETTEPFPSLLPVFLLPTPPSWGSSGILGQFPGEKPERSLSPGQRKETRHTQTLSPPGFHLRYLCPDSLLHAQGCRTIGCNARELREPREGREAGGGETRTSGRKDSCWVLRGASRVSEAEPQ